MKTKKDRKNIYRVTSMEAFVFSFKEDEFFLTNVKDSLHDSKFVLIDKKADEFIASCTKVPDEKTGFQYRYQTNPETEEDFKNFLIKNKDFVYQYISSRQTFVGSHIYQLYLQYALHILSDPERSLFLDAYINMYIDLHAPASEVLTEKRQMLEKSLRINQGL